MSKALYHIEQVSNCILVTLRGEWSESTNIQYLAALSEYLKRRRGRPFILLVDMRTWQIPKSETFNQIKAPFKLDRRNQLYEIWLECEGTDADHVAEKMRLEAKTPLERTHSVSQFLASCADKTDNKALAHITAWVENESVDKQN
ncbi:hypothetical protein D210916BOD24_30690 [Alteromonas sp. D210916BOD_24]|uniref:arginine decarboxylase n=1 Tax=Alteromonas sp. D210916BOD_24 TaxID=3157618 RepID=UPI00399D02A7